ncbi:MAG TPA: phosphoribosylformylglycinamidine cyclo-ligase [Thermomicrobiales bacterium]|nr:phosphoribosylformylglycinamidine cyclo-ligase [Thermomicrobiales bacterium]
MSAESAKSISYRDAGVDIDRATRSLSAIAGFARATSAAGAAGDIGHFGGIFRLPAGDDRLLIASADGIGTKIKIAFVIGGDAHKRVGGDLVNHCVNDILACGARPLFFLDYIAMGKIDPIALEGLVEGMALACTANGAALIGGETAEMPGLYAAGEYDAAGFIVGEVAPDAYIDGSTIQSGDALIGIPSAGMHTNGYSLARMIVGLTGEVEHDWETLSRPLPGGDGESIGEALLAPHMTYFPVVYPLVQQDLVRGIAHITGGGLLDNVPRMLPGGVVAELDQQTWTVDPLFTYLVETGHVEARDRYRAFNMGIGMVLAVRPGDVDTVLRAVPGARVIGETAVRDEEHKVTIEGTALGTVR